MDTKTFIEKARKIHGDKYDYSKVEYTNTKTKVCIICPIHGEFWITPHNHIQHRGCKKCGDIMKGKSWEKRDISKIKNEALETFIEKARKIHGDKYDYSKVEYTNSVSKVCIICPIHGESWITPRQHLKGCGCNECSKEILSIKRKMGKEKFIERARKIHGDKYDYSKVEYVGSKSKVCIVCKEHGEFFQTPSAHINLKQGCPRCNESHLEKKIRTDLKNNNIEFIPECSKDVFPWLKLQKLDFYLPKYNIAIECQGKQHLNANAFSSREKKRDFERQIKNDVLKKEKCENNGIKLYYIVENIEYTLNSKIPIYNKSNTFVDLNDILYG